VIRTHDPSVRAGEDSSRLRPRGHCDRHITALHCKNIQKRERGVLIEKEVSLTNFNKTQQLVLLFNHVLEQLTAKSNTVLQLRKSIYAMMTLRGRNMSQKEHL
jgi:hypothetical protein